MMNGKRVHLLLLAIALVSSGAFGTMSKKKPLKIEAESGMQMEGAGTIESGVASGKAMVSLRNPGEGIRFTALPGATKLAVRYAGTAVGTLTVVVDDTARKKIHLHATGSATEVLRDAIIDVEIPAKAALLLCMEEGDVTANIDYITVGNGELNLPPDIWNLGPLPVASGPFLPDWEKLSRVYAVPAWWRDAKLGAWSHWTPQSMPEQGDWYARGMYMQGSAQYKSHLEQFGHPSEYGYKDICHNWQIERWDPEALMDLYIEMGARYFMAMGVHHDNFDCYDSQYQPWNSVNVGPKKDIVGIWEKVARERGMRFGIGFHNTPGRTWGQFMTVRYTGDATGNKQGVPYDAMQTLADGKGKWWDGMDPADLYGPVHDKRAPLLSPYANQFMWRIDDAITKYHPDVIYFDEHAGDSQVDLGVQMGLGFLAPPLLANYYNKSLQWNKGKMEVVVNLKGVGGRYNSFQNSPNLLPHVDRSLVKSTEAIIEPEIMAYSFQTETTIADWHYKKGQTYMSAHSLITLLMENVCRNGTMLLNLTQHGQGNLDPEVVAIAKELGTWLKIHGEAVYGSRPFEIYGEGDVRYTRNNGYLYATLLNWDGKPLTLASLAKGGATLGNVSKVELMGSNQTISFTHNEESLSIQPESAIEPLKGLSDATVATKYRVLRITHDKGWMNDDDREVTYPGWIRQCNLNAGHYNNDLTVSQNPGEVWSCSFSGPTLAVIAPKQQGAGSIEIQIDNQPPVTVSLNCEGECQPQQTVYARTNLSPGKHTLKITHEGEGVVAVDAVICAGAQW